MTRFVSVERIPADTLFARATSPENRSDAGARHLAEEPWCSSAFLFFQIAAELISLGLFLTAAIVWLAVGVGTL